VSWGRRGLAVTSMPEGTSGGDALRVSLREIGRADGIAAVRRLSGGVIADAWLISRADGTSAVGKIVNGAVPDLFRTAADGLAALRGTGHLATPDVLAVTDRLLLLEVLVPRDDSAGSWEAFARDMAGAHRAVISGRFGWPADGWLGRLRQVNTWNADGHEFFAEQRLLRYLTEPPAEQALTAGDRRAVERLCARLPELIPPMPAVLTHGDLWTGNLVSQPRGQITVIDPAVSYTWAEVDLSMLWGNPRPPASDRFFAVYQELNPSPPGWTDRMPVLHLRELLSSIAHFGPGASYDLGRVRDTLGPFYQH
jgi:fructosamine-3-kinase